MEQTIYYTTNIQDVFYSKSNLVSLRSAIIKVVIFSQEHKENIKINLSVNVQMSNNQNSNSLDSKRDEGNQTKIETLPVSTQTDIVFIDGCFTQLSRCIPRMFKKQIKNEVQEETEKSNPSQQAHDGPSTQSKETITEDDEEEMVMKVIHPTDENAQGVPQPEELSPLFALFPDLITTYPMPESLQCGNISTTDITRELVSLGTKADFTKLKPSSRLIPPRKAWLSALHEVPREVEKMEEVEGESSDEDLGKLHYLEDKGLSLESSTSF